MNVLLASGLMQYFNVLLALLISDMATPPKWVILNKVFVRSGPSLVTLKKSGPARVPYQIRGGLAWEDEMNALGYPLLHQWTIPSFSYRTSTHPRLGESRSLGYVLARSGEQL
jgi:putative methyltransferase (TIGR04325 family)